MAGMLSVAAENKWEGDIACEGAVSCKGVWALTRRHSMKAMSGRVARQGVWDTRGKLKVSPGSATPHLGFWHGQAVSHAAAAAAAASLSRLFSLQ